MTSVQNQLWKKLLKSVDLTNPLAKMYILIYNEYGYLKIKIKNILN
jgi:hypothetical protein